MDDSDSDSSSGSDSTSGSSPNGGRRRRHRRGGESDSYSDSGSDDSREMGRGRRRRRHRRGGESIKEFADAAQTTYNTLKGKVDAVKNQVPSYLPGASNAKAAVDKVEALGDKIFGIYDFIKANVPLIKEALALGPTKVPALQPTVDKIKSVIEAAGFGKHAKQAMENHLRRHFGKRSQYSLMKKVMLGGSFIGDKFYELSPAFKDSGKAAINSLIDGNPTYKKADTVLQTVNDIYSTLQSQKTNIRNLVDRTLTPDKAGKVKNAMTAVGLGRKGKRAPSKRNMLVSKLMKEHGMSLPEASRKASQMMKGGEL
jgi:hypothetical protein